MLPISRISPRSASSSARPPSPQVALSATRPSSAPACTGTTSPSASGPWSPRTATRWTTQPAPGGLKGRVGERAGGWVAGRVGVTHAEFRPLRVNFRRCRLLIWLTPGRIWPKSDRLGPNSAKARPSLRGHAGHGMGTESANLGSESTKWADLRSIPANSTIYVPNSTNLGQILTPNILSAKSDVGRFRQTLGRHQLGAHLSEIAQIWTDLGRIGADVGQFWGRCWSTLGRLGRTRDALAQHVTKFD